MNARRLNFALLTSFLATVFAVSLVGAVFHFKNGGRPTPDQALAELRLAADTSLADRLRRLTEQGDAPAVELLVRALAHERAALRRAAREVIGERLDRWSLLSRPEASQRAALLARELRLQARQFPADVRPFVADVVTRIVLLPGEPLVDDCVATLRQLGPAPRQEVIPPLVDSSSPSRSERGSDSTRTAGTAPVRQ